MRRTEQIRRWQALLAVLVWAAVKAYAEDSSAPPRIVVSIPDRKLAVLEADGRVTRIYQTAVGAPVSPSPTGRFTVVTRVSHPTYYGHGKVVAPSPANPLGTRWMGLSAKGYGIHGTSAPRSIGRAASHGCIRMRNAEVEELFEQIKVGDAVEIHGERDETVVRIFGPEPQLLAGNVPNL